MEIDIYVADLTVKLIDIHRALTQQQVISWQRPDQKRIRQVSESMVFVKPNKIFGCEEGIVLIIGNLTFDVYYPGESHSPDNLVVYIEEIGVLFRVCMVKSLFCNNLGFTGDANITEWPKSMQIVRDRYLDAQTVIPHHGEW